MKSQIYLLFLLLAGAQIQAANLQNLFSQGGTQGVMCPYGYYFYGPQNKCISFCDQGETYQNGICVKSGQSTPIQPTPTTPSKPTITNPTTSVIRCSQNEILVNGNCICAQGYIRQNQKCVKQDQQPTPLPQTTPSPACTENCGKSRQVTNENSLKTIFSPPPKTVYQSDLSCVGGICTPSRSPPQITTYRVNIQSSETNNQEQNIDEADIIKTDSGFIYTLSNKILTIVNAYPIFNFRKLSTIHVKSYEPQNIFIISSDILVIIGTRKGFSTSHTVFTIFNVKNKACPILLTQDYIEGQYFAGRRVDDFVYIVSKHGFIDRPNPAPEKSFGQKNMLLKDIIYYQGDYTLPVFVNIVAFNPIRQRISAKSIITEQSEVLYMSDNSIYFAFHGKDETGVHKVYIKETSIIPFADIKIPGNIKDQFSFDEEDYNLRVVTTYSKGKKQNSVFILDFFLNPLGILRDFSSNSDIFSVRFVRNRVYVVTYDKISPFITISLSNPRNPYVMSALKLTSVSRYLHPYDEQNIIGIGQEINLYLGRPEGIRISLFDVSNPIYPKQIGYISVKDASVDSLAFYEHKAFLINRQYNYFVIPLVVGSQLFRGAYVVGVNQFGLVDRKIIRHKKSVERSLWIQNYVYTKSQCEIQVHDSLNFQLIKTDSLPCNEYQVINNAFCQKNPGFGAFLAQLPGN